MTPLARARRCLLFFPAVRPDQLAKAARTGTDMVCVDCEDAVAHDRKEEARRSALALLSARPQQRAEIVLRINSPRTPEGLRDLVALLDDPPAADTLMLPKTGSADEVRWVEALVAPALPDLRLLPMIETAEGLENAAAIAAASPRVTALMLGGIDLAAELGCALEWGPLLHARSRVVHAARLAGVDAIDMPFLDTADEATLASDARKSARLGFDGKAAIHPRQVGPIQAAFSPADDAVEQARRVIAAYEANRGGVLLVDGRLVEPPVIRAAERTLAIAAAMEAR